MRRGRPAAKAAPSAFWRTPNAGSLSWSPDGTYLTFTTSQRTEPGDVMRVDLCRARRSSARTSSAICSGRAAEDAGAADRTAPPAGLRRTCPVAPAESHDRSKPVEIVFDDIRQRVSVLPVGVDVTRAGDQPRRQVAAAHRDAPPGQQNLYVYLARRAVEGAGRRAPAHVHARRQADRAVHARQQGGLLPRAGPHLSVTARDARAAPIAVTAELDVDFAAREDGGLPPGVDVPARQLLRRRSSTASTGTRCAPTTRRASPGAQTPDEMRRMLNLMVGELNASHMGVGGAGAGATPPSLGRLGLRFDRARVRAAAAGCASPSDRAARPGGARRRCKVGRLPARGRRHGRSSARTNLDELLAYTIGKRTRR